MKSSFIKKYVSTIVILLISFANCPAAKCTWLKDDEGKLRPFYTVNWNTNEPLQWYAFNLYQLPFPPIASDLFASGQGLSLQNKAPLLNDLIKKCKDGWWDAGDIVHKNDAGDINNNIIQKDGGQLKKWDEVPMLVKFINDEEEEEEEVEYVAKLDKELACDKYKNFNTKPSFPWKENPCDSELI
jgi:hypothetical protein